MSEEHEHIVKSFSEDLIQLKNMILKMAGLVENQLQLSLDSILKHDSKECVKIIKSDNEIDKLHINIQNYVERIITLRQPISLDLRNVLAAMQIARELERVGDLAVNIAKRAMVITQHAKIDKLYDLEEYTKETTQSIEKFTTESDWINGFLNVLAYKNIKQVRC